MTLEAFTQNSAWPAAQKVYETLTSQGFKALLAGGCVRDALLGRVPKDFDVVTDATPDQVQALFPRTLAIGKQFGIIMVLIEDQQIEVATFRRDMQYRDGRRPEKIEFGTLEEDAERRDFTVNALYYDLGTQQVIDLVGGQKDLEARLIRSVGAATERFREDKLRMIRAARFVAQLGFTLEETTLKSIEPHASDIFMVSYERIRDEMTKLLLAPHRLEGMYALRDSGLLMVIFEPLIRELGETWLQIEAFLKKNIETSEIERVWLWFFYPAYAKRDLATREATLDKYCDFLRLLKFSNLSINRIRDVFRTHESFLRNVRLGEKLAALDNDHALKELIFKDVTEVLAGEMVAVLPKVMAEYQKRKTEQGKLPSALISGEDLSQRGWSAGPQMGAMLRELYMVQLEQNISSKDELMSKVKRA